jgi:hypothetical protein
MGNWEHVPGIPRITLKDRFLVDRHEWVIGNMSPEFMVDRHEWVIGNMSPEFPNFLFFIIENCP